MSNKFENVFVTQSKPCFGLLRTACLIAAPAVLAGCLATNPSSGGGSATAVTGAAAGESTAGANSALERCSETLGTLRIEGAELHVARDARGRLNLQRLQPEAKPDAPGVDAGPSAKPQAGYPGQVPAEDRLPPAVLRHACGSWFPTAARCSLTASPLLCWPPSHGLPAA